MTEQQPVRLFFALMARGQERFDACERVLAEEFGPIDLRDAPYAFDPHTGYYAREFGTGLEKRIVAARDPIAPERLVDVKLRTNAIEMRFARESDPDAEAPRRTINIDPGYLNHSKVVLATTKDQAHRIYIDRGIFEEVTLSYRRAPGAYEPNPWTYPDYRAPERLAFFARLRQAYCEQLKGNG